MPNFPEDLRLYVGLASAGAIVILALLVVFLSIRNLRDMFREEKARPKGLEARAPHSLDEFYEAHYAAEQFPRGVVLDTVTRFATACHVSTRFLQPDDSFDSVGVTQHDDCERFAVETAMLIKEAEQRFGVSLFGGRLVTLDDYVRVNVLADRLAARGQAAENK